MEPILIGLIAIALLARHAINLRFPRTEPVAHEPITHVRTLPTPTQWESTVNAALIARYQRLADTHTEIYLAGGSAEALNHVRAQMHECERDLTQRGLATPTCS